MIWFQFDPKASTGATLQERVYRHIRDRILSGELAAGVRLPSSRALAQRLELSRNTVSLAYEWLSTEGYLEARHGSGTYVASLLTERLRTVVPDARSDAQPEERSSASPVGGVSSRIVPTYRPIVSPPVRLETSAGAPRFDFRYGSPDPRDFPVQAWRRLASEVLLHERHGLSSYVDPAGVRELREAIAVQLAATRGMQVSVERIIVTSGAQDGLHLIAQLLGGPTSRLALEDPGYASAATVFQHQGTELLPIPLDEEGLRVELLPSKGVALVYTTPSHQFPVGTTMSLRRRVALLDWAQHAGAYVLEDDYDSDYRYEGPPLAALAALDIDQRVIYLGSFSKALGAGLRLGYLVLPEELVGPVCALKRMNTYGHSWLDQSILAQYMHDGAYERRLRALRKNYLLRRDALVAGLRDVFPWAYSLQGVQAGMHFSLFPGPDAPDTNRLLVQCLTEGVRMYSFTSAGVFQSAETLAKGPEPLLMGYSMLTPDEIQAAMAAIGRAIGAWISRT